MLTRRRCDLALGTPILADGVGNVVGQLVERFEHVSVPEAVWINPPITSLTTQEIAL